MGRARFIACALLMLCPLALTRHDDDFAFDNSEEFLVELTANHSEIAKNGLRRLWGVPDTSAYVGHLFRMEIPKEAFSGKVLAYKVRSEDGRRMPSWLAVDSRHGLISGVPQKQDLGTHTFTVTAHGSTRGLTATDSFTVEVKKSQDKPHSKYGSCVGEESRLVLVIMVDGSFHSVAPRQRIRALMQLASFMALDGNEFWMEPYKAETHADTIMSGTGSSRRRHGDATTAIYLNVGCGNKLWKHHKVLVAGLREQARDGTLAHVLRLPVIGWRLQAIQPAPRIKRQLEGSGGGIYDGAYDDDDADADGDPDADADYSGYDDNDDDGAYTNNDDGITDLVSKVTGLFGCARPVFGSVRPLFGSFLAMSHISTTFYQNLPFLNQRERTPCSIKSACVLLLYMKFKKIINTFCVTLPVTIQNIKLSIICQKCGIVRKNHCGLVLASKSLDSSSKKYLT